MKKLTLLFIAFLTVSSLHAEILIDSGYIYSENTSNRTIYAHSRNFNSLAEKLGSEAHIDPTNIPLDAPTYQDTMHLIIEPSLGIDTCYIPIEWTIKALKLPAGTETRLIPASISAGRSAATKKTKKTAKIIQCPHEVSVSINASSEYSVQKHLNNSPRIDSSIKLAFRFYIPGKGDKTLNCDIILNSFSSDDAYYKSSCTNGISTIPE
ncbi:hypothetical protein AAIR98_001154 [Elusimicrobium simillimum]|uniref:hypothetical protein n=1 Tax=Elusimicrobium simillimum TaxID=3143438 RepID=UPI003C70353E